jgi:clan AA aspartic protease
VIDTGYTGSLTLPPSFVTALNLNWQKVDRGMLADGSECLFDVFEAELEWDGQLRRVLVDEADTDPLVGMALLSGYELRVEVCSQGRVEIAPLSPSRSQL